MRLNGRYFSAGRKQQICNLTRYMLARVINNNLCASACGSTESISAQEVVRSTRPPRRCSWRGRHSGGGRQVAHDAAARRNADVAEGRHGAGIIRRGRHRTRKYLALSAGRAWTRGQRRRGCGLGHGIDTLRDRGRVAHARRAGCKEPNAKIRMQGAACRVLVSRGSVVGRPSTARAAFHGFDRTGCPTTCRIWEILELDTWRRSTVGSVGCESLHGSQLPGG